MVGMSSGQPLTLSSAQHTTNESTQQALSQHSASMCAPVCSCMHTCADTGRPLSPPAAACTHPACRPPPEPVGRGREQPTLLQTWGLAINTDLFFLFQGPTQVPPTKMPPPQRCSLHKDACNQIPITPANTQKPFTGINKFQQSRKFPTVAKIPAPAP